MPVNSPSKRPLAAVANNRIFARVSSLKLGTKLLLAFLFAAILPLSAISTYTLSTVSDAFSQTKFEILQTVGHDRLSTLDAYFSRIEKHIEEVAYNPLVVESAKQFSSAFKGLTGDEQFLDESTVKQLDRDRTESVTDYYVEQFMQQLSGEDKASTSTDSLLPRSKESIALQEMYISDNPHPLGSKNNMNKADGNYRYNTVHNQYHSFFNRILKSEGYYDIFLVDPESGYIVYSVYKEIDYATSLNQGPHANSGIARAYKAALSDTSYKTHLEDFSPYLPSYNAPASFISKPIIENEKVVGVLIFQIPLDQITDTISKDIGLGESGKSYVVGAQDGLLRTQLPGIDENTILQSYPNTAVNSAEGYTRYTDYFGRSVEAYVSLADIHDMKWRIVVEQDTEESFKYLTSIRKGYLIAFAVSLIITVSIALLMLFHLRRQLGAEPDFLNKITTEIAEGDLTRDFPDHQQLTGTFQSMVAMQQILKERNEQDSKNLDRIGRLRDGLRKLSTPVALASVDRRITFANQALEELLAANFSSLREIAPTLDPSQIIDFDISQFSLTPGELENTIATITDVHHYELIAGSSIFKVSLNPVYSDTGDRVGTSMEWQDITEARRVIEEVDAAVKSANQGALDHQINLQNKSGVYLTLSQGINGLLDVNRQFVADVSNFVEALSRGDLSQTIDREYAGSFAEVQRDANQSSGKLREVVDNIDRVANSVDTAAREMNSGNAELSQRTERAAASLQETATSMGEITQSVSQTAENSQQAKQLSYLAQEYAEKGGDVVGKAVESMDGISASSRRISDITSVIDDIAFQTNLLALNASVEAARAGEQGRGFAVVATEVRNLATRSAEAAKEIKELIDNSVQQVADGTRLVNESGKALHGVVEHIKQVSDVITEISTACQEQSEGIKSVDTAISQLDDATQQNAALVEEASAASALSTEQAASLLELIEFFSTPAATPDRHLRVVNG